MTVKVLIGPTYIKDGLIALISNGIEVNFNFQCQNGRVLDPVSTVNIVLFYL